MGVVTPLNNPGGPEGDTVTVAEKLLNTEYWFSTLGSPSLAMWLFAAGRMVLRFFLGSHGTLVAVSAPLLMPLRDSGHSNECSLYVL